MSKPGCPFFNCAKPLAKRLHSEESGFSVYIAEYNKWINEKYKNDEARIQQLLISDTALENLSENERGLLLDRWSKALYKFISGPRLTVASNSIYQSTDDLTEEEYNQILENYNNIVSSQTAYSRLITSNVFSAEERAGFRSELISQLNSIADTYSMSPGELLENVGFTNIMNIIKEQYADTLVDLKSEIEAETDPKEKAILEYKYGRVSEVVSCFNYLVTINLSEFKRVFGKGFNPDSRTLFSETENTDKFSEESELFDIEENVYERWQVALESMDPTGSLAAAVNHALSYVPTVRIVYTMGEDGKINKTSEVLRKTPFLELDWVCNPRIEARKLLKLLNGCTSITSMMERLKADPKYDKIVEILDREGALGDRLKNTFFQSFNRFFSTHTATSIVNGVATTTPLNVTNRKVSAYGYKYKILNKPEIFLYENGSIYTIKDGKVAFDDDEVEIFRNFVERFVGKPDSEGYEFFFTKKVSFLGEERTVQRSVQEKAAIVETILRELNIIYDESAPALILSDENTLFEFLRSVTLIADKLKGIKKTPSVFLGNNTITDVFGKIMQAVDGTKTMGQSMSSMTRISTENGTKSITSYTQMSQLSQFLKECKNLSPEYLRKVIMDTYGNDETIYDFINERFRVRWLQDLYDSTFTDSINAIRKRMGITRNLVVNGIEDEKLSDKEREEATISSYFNDNALNADKFSENNIEYIDLDIESNSPEDILIAFKDSDIQVKDKTYYYVRGTSKAVYHLVGNSYSVVERTRRITIPTFSTGDNLSLRMIRSLHYDKKEIIDGMYDLYVADIRNIEKKKDLIKAGIAVTGNNEENYTMHPGYFGFLEFFNPNTRSVYKDNNIWKTSSTYWGERLEKIKGDKEFPFAEDVKALLEEYLDTQAEYFRDICLPGLGISKESLSYIQNNDLGIGETLEEKLNDFFYNYKFSRMNQFAISDITPDIMPQSEEKSKRNKGNQTTGSQFITDAIDSVTGQPVWGNENPHQNIVYFYEVRPSLSEEDKTMLNKVLGSTEDYIKGSPLTDGQGWRNFDSWRKIGLSFEGAVWDSSMEAAYWKVKQISKEIYDIEDKVADIENKISEKEAVLKGLKNNPVTKESLPKGKFPLETLQEETKNWESSVSKLEEEIGKLKEPLEDEKWRLNNKKYELADIAVVFQPRKPLCQGIETYTHNGKDYNFGFQHKYAEIPIIPAMFPKGHAMRELGRYMEDHDIDMICSSKVGKKGVFGEIDLQYKVNENGIYIDAEGNIIKGYDAYGNEVTNPTRAEQRRNSDFKKLAVENNSKNNPMSMREMLDAQFHINPNTKVIENDESEKVVAGVIHHCPLKTYIIQNNVPNHVYSDSNFGVQLRKIILGGINKSGNYEYKLGNKTVKINGEQLIQLYNAAVSWNYMNSYISFLRSISNPSRLIKDMCDLIVANDRCDLATIDKIAAGIPFYDSALQHDTFASLISLFRNKVVKQKIEGGNIVQASALGNGTKLSYLNEGLKFETDKNGYPVACEAIIPFNFQVTIASGETIELEYEDYCNADGTFKTDGEGNTLIEKDYPGILDIIAYRIPTEAEYSALKLHIVKCNPKVGANYIQLPTICTTRAGFDFDIDKLFFIRRSFDSSYDDYFVKRVWDAVFEAHPDIAEALQDAKKQATEEDKEVIRKKYEEAGAEIPKDANGNEDIPINRFWEVAIRLDGFKDPEDQIFKSLDKSKLFKEFAKKDSEYVKKSHFIGIDITNEDGTVNYEKLFEKKVTKAQVDNLLLDIILARMSDSETAKARFTAGGFGNTTKESKIVRKINNLSLSNVDVETINGVKTITNINKAISHVNLDSENMCYSDPMTDIEFYRLNQAASELIGIYANDSSNYHLFSLVESMESTIPIVFGSFVGKEGEGINMLVKESQGMTIKHRLAELIAAAVDAVKDPCLDYLNLNPITGEMATVLIRMGYTCKEVGLLFNQPIIKECTDLMKRERISSINEAMNIVLKNHDMKGVRELRGTKTNPTKVNTNYLTTGALAYNLVNKNLDKDYYKASQANVALTFLNIASIKNEFSEIVQMTRNSSSNVVQSTIGEFLARRDKIMNYLSKKNRIINVNINNKDSILEKSKIKLLSKSESLGYFKQFANHPFSFEVVLYNLINDGLNTLLENNSPYTGLTFDSVFSTLKEWKRYGTLTGDSYNMVINNFMNVAFSKLPGDLNPNEKAREDLYPIGWKGEKNLTNAELFLNHMIDFEKDTESIKNEEILYFLYESDFRKALGIEDVTLKDNTIVSAYSMQINHSLDKETKDNISSDWGKIITLGDTEEHKRAKRWAVAVFFNLYYRNGFNNTKDFSRNFVPQVILNMIQVSKDTYGRPMSYIDFEQSFIDSGVVGNDASKAIESIVGNSGGNNPFVTDILSTIIKSNLDNPQFCQVVRPEEGVSTLEDWGLTLKKKSIEQVTHSVGNKVFASPYVIYNNEVYELSTLKNGTTKVGNSGFSLIPAITYTKVKSSTDVSNFSNLINDQSGYLYGTIKVPSIFISKDSTSEEIEYNSDNSEGENTFNQTKEELKGENPHNICP